MPIISRRHSNLLELNFKALIIATLNTGLVWKFCHLAIELVHKRGVKKLTCEVDAIFLEEKFLSLCHS
jgi:hypothetical protein